LARVRYQVDPGYIVFIEDPRKVGAVKVTGHKKFPVTNVRVVAWFKTDLFTKTLTALYRELIEFRIEGDWYVKDAVDMYLDHRQGLC
jgi:hypothetical protein